MRIRRLLALGLVAVSCFAAAARGEITRSGDLITTFSSEISPKVLPRQRPVPVAVSVSGDFKTVAKAPLPQLRTISVAINRAGQLFDRGLPTCRVAAIQPATEAAARALCSGAIVGSGHVSVEVHLENQAPFLVRAHLLAFNGPTRHGRKLILAQVYAKSPPGAFVLTFKLKKKGGLFGTTMSTVLPPSAQSWAYLTHFDMKLSRRYRFRGRPRSFVSAACGAPAGFPGAVFPLAKARYGFANGQTTKLTVVRNCRLAR